MGTHMHTFHVNTNTTTNTKYRPHPSLNYNRPDFCFSPRSPQSSPLDYKEDRVPWTAYIETDCLSVDKSVVKDDEINSTANTTVSIGDLLTRTRTFLPGSLPGPAVHRVQQSEPEQMEAPHIREDDQWPSVLEQLHSSTRSDHSWPSVVEQIRRPVPNSTWNDLVDADATAEVGDFDEVCNESCSQPVVSAPANTTTPAWASPLKTWARGVKQKRLRERKAKQAARAAREAEAHKKNQSWTQVISSRSGRRYYLNTHTGDTTWQLPQAVQAAQERAAAQESEVQRAAAENAEKEFDAFFGGSQDPFQTTDPFACDVFVGNDEDPFCIRVPASQCADLQRNARKSKWRRTKKGTLKLRAGAVQKARKRSQHVNRGCTRLTKQVPLVGVPAAAA